jgi:hypothetical protein
MQRRLIGIGELTIGLCAGAATILACALVLLLLGLIPSQASHQFFGVWYLKPLSGWFADAVLAPFWGVTTRPPPNGIYSMGLSFGALLVFAAIVWAVGRRVRRRVPPALRQQSVTLLVAALVVAACAAIVAATLPHTSPAIEGDLSRPGGAVSYGPLSHFFGAFAATLLLGAFSFGVVGLLPQPWASALRRAGALLGVCLLAGGLLFPVFVVSDGLPGANIDQDLGLASRFAAAAGGLALPLALQAPVSLAQGYVSPWASRSARSEENWIHWRKLAHSTAGEHPDGRLYQHAASLGVLGSPAGAALTLGVACGLVFISVGLCRRAGPRTLGGGLRLGILQGIVVASLLATTLWLTSYYVRMGLPRPLDLRPGSMMSYWGITAVGLAQSVATILLVCGLTGLVYGVRQARLASEEADARVTPAAAVEPRPG